MSDILFPPIEKMSQRPLGGGGYGSAQVKLYLSHCDTVLFNDI